MKLKCINLYLYKLLFMYHCSWKGEKQQTRSDSPYEHIGSSLSWTSSPHSPGLTLENSRWKNNNIRWRHFRQLLVKDVAAAKVSTSVLPDVWAWGKLLDPFSCAVSRLTKTRPSGTSPPFIYHLLFHVNVRGSQRELTSASRSPFYGRLKSWKRVNFDSRCDYRRTRPVVSGASNLLMDVKRPASSKECVFSRFSVSCS